MPPFGCPGLQHREFGMGPTLGQKPPKSRCSLRSQGTREAEKSIITETSTFLLHLRCRDQSVGVPWMPKNRLSVDDEGQSRQQERTGSQPPRATDHASRKTHTEVKTRQRSILLHLNCGFDPQLAPGTWSAKLERPLPCLQLGPQVNGRQPLQGAGGQPRRREFDPIRKGTLSQGRAAPNMRPLATFPPSLLDQSRETDLPQGRLIYKAPS